MDRLKRTTRKINSGRLNEIGDREVPRKSKGNTVVGKKNGIKNSSKIWQMRTEHSIESGN